jgi:hypothetical protein
MLRAGKSSPQGGCAILLSECKILTGGGKRQGKQSCKAA